MANENTSDKRSILKEEYPRNLLLAVRGAWEQEEPTELTADVLAGIQYALSTLNEREQLVLCRRYKDGKKLREIGEEIGVKQERSRQIETAALRKLRYPRNMFFMTKGVDEYIKKRCKVEYERGYQVGYNAGYQQGVDEASNGVSKAGISVTIVSLPIEALDLSVRSFNALRRAGYVTIGDLLNVDEKGIIHIKNLGTKQRQEVAVSLYRYGISQTAWDIYCPGMNE